MGLILSVRPAGDGILVAVSGAVDVGTETPLQQVLLRILGERRSVGPSNSPRQTRPWPGS